MLQFKDVSTQEGTLESIGTVAEFVGKNGYHELASAKNFKNDAKRVCLALYNAKGQRTYVNCSRTVSEDLRASKNAEELKEKLEAIATYPILELPQLDEDGEPVMVMNEETGKEEPLVLYSVSYQGGTDMSATRTVITPAMLKAETVKRTIDWNDLVAL